MHRQIPKCRMPVEVKDPNVRLAFGAPTSSCIGNTRPNASVAAQVSGMVSRSSAAKSDPTVTVMTNPRHCCHEGK